MMSTGVFRGRMNRLLVCETHGVEFDAGKVGARAKTKA
jgi:hypothetical protein